MNVINVTIDFAKGTCEKNGISLITGDYNTTKVVFTFDDSAIGRKVFEMKNPNGDLVYVDEIVNDEVVLVGVGENDEIYSLFDEEGDYTFEVSLYGDNSKITSVHDYITANKEQVIVDGEVVEGSLTLFDNLMQELNEAIYETNNLDIDAEKVDHTTTITVTKKDGSQETAEINDGEIPDLSDYVKNTDYARTSKAGVIKSGYYGLQVDSNNGKAYCDTYTYSTYNGIENQRFISKGTLENVITGKDLTTKAYVDSLVGDVETILEELDIGGGV